MAEEEDEELLDVGSNVNFGFYLQSVGDIRWEGVKAAREAARAAVDRMEKARPAKRRKAVAQAAEAVAEISRQVQRDEPPIAGTGGSPLDIPARDDVAESLEALQAYLTGLAEAERIALSQARDAAAQWAAIEASLMADRHRDEEEMLVVLALAV